MSNGKRDTGFCGLVKENKYVMATIAYDDKPAVKGNFRERIFQQENGKLHYILSKKIKFGRDEEQIYFEVGDMKDEAFLDTYLIVTPHNIHIDRHAPYSIFVNFIENRLPSKVVLILIFLALWLLQK